MLKTVQAKVLAALAALGLSSGVVLTLTSDSCTVKPAGEAVDAGQLADTEKTSTSQGVHDELTETCHD